MRMKEAEGYSPNKTLYQAANTAQITIVVVVCPS
uniref:Uncharacterized protein n=1 Tax=Arundo donax TaxID=35708 RepID=A0A0A9U7M8_ARUDO